MDNSRRTSNPRFHSLFIFPPFPPRLPASCGNHPSKLSVSMGLLVSEHRPTESILQLPDDTMCLVEHDVKSTFITHRTCQHGARHGRTETNFWKYHPRTVIENRNTEPAVPRAASSLPRLSTIHLSCTPVTDPFSEAPSSPPVPVTVPSLRSMFHVQFVTCIP